MENQLTKDQSLEIITRMIAEAKKNYSTGGSFYLLLWGWVISMTNFAHYLLIQVDYMYPYIVWLSTIPTAVITVVHSRRYSRHAQVKTFVDKIYGQIWIAVSMAIVILLIFMNQIDMNHNPVILLVAGIGTYLTGNLLRFKPVIYGGVLLWIGGFIGFLLPVNEQYLLAGLFIILGYLIPGYLLKKTERA